MPSFFYKIHLLWGWLFNITSNTNWTVTSSAAWATISPASGSNNSTVTVTAAENTDTSPRTATITVSGTGVTAQTISITQADSVPANTDFEVIGNTLIKYHGAGGAVVIPSDLGITNIGRDAFSSNQTITSVTIPEGVISIEQLAFTLCTNLVSLSIPRTVTSIGFSITQNSCNKFMSFDVDSRNPNYSSENGILFNKNKTTLILYPPGKQGAYTIPRSVTSIQAWAFQGCRELTSIDIPNTITSIDDNTFCYCTKLTSVTIPENVTHLGSASFYGCTSLTSVTIPTSLTGTGNNVFYDCSNLGNVYVKWTTPLNINSTIFTNANTSNCTLHVPAGTKALYRANSVWNTFGTILEEAPIYTLSVSPASLSFVAAGEQKTFNIVSNTDWTVTSSVAWATISPASGSNNGTVTVTAAENTNTSLRTATITINGTGVTEQTISITQQEAVISNPDFENDNDVLVGYNGEGGDVVIPDDMGITTIGEGAFEGNTTITSVIIPSGVTEIGKSAFMSCENLATVNLPNTVATIKEEAFYNSGLGTVTLPNSIKSISAGAFGACETLTAININPTNRSQLSDDADALTADARSSNSSYSTAAGVLYDKAASLLHTYPGGKTGAFSVPNSVTTIGEKAFYTSKASVITLNENIRSIEKQAFSGCKGLEIIDIPSSVSSIGQSAFENSSKLEAINVNDNNANYSSEEGILYNKDKTQLITSPENKPGAAFEIPSSVTIIKENAFQNSANLEAVEIPSSVKEIQNLAFSNCNALKEITVNWSTPPSVSTNTFRGINTAKVTLYVPEGKEAAYQNAAVWKNFKITSAVGTEQIEQPSLQARLISGTLYVTGLQPGEIVSVYSINGQCVYQGTAKAEELQIVLEINGIYVVSAGKRTVKIIKN